jgi:hypothetical protein
MEIYRSESLSVSCAELRLKKLACSGDAKVSVTSYLRHVESNALMKARGIPVPKLTLHKLFYGEENCGKEELAVLVGLFYNAYGFLDKGHTVAINSSELFDGSGNFAACEVFKKACGGVLYLREVKSLCKDFDGEKREEIQSAFLKGLHNCRIAVIIGDSKENLIEFFDLYPALREPFGVDTEVGLEVNSFSFSSLTSYELYSVFEQCCLNAGLSISNEASEKLKNYISSQFATAEPDNVKTARDLFKAVLEKHNKRVTSGDGTNPTEVLSVDLP